MFHPDTAILASLAGGILIGTASVLMMALRGRIAGISGIAAGLLPPFRDAEFAARAAFVAGLGLAPVVWFAMSGQTGVKEAAGSPVLLLAGGLLVGFGTVWGYGCTSGHGVCGLSRRSVRSLVATLVFMGAAAATVFIVRHLASS